jgi:hypothetical protein
MQLKWPFGPATIDPDKFRIRFRARGDFEQPLRRLFQGQSDFLAQLAHSAGVVILAGIHVAGGRRVPFARLAVFGHRTLLEKSLAARIEDQDVDRAMFQAQPMHLAARLAINHLVVFVDNIEDFFGHKCVYDKIEARRAQRAQYNFFMDPVNFKSRIFSTFHNFKFVFDEDLDRGGEINRLSAEQQIMAKSGAFLAGGLVAALGTKYPKYSTDEVKAELQKIRKYCDAVALRLDTGGATLALFIYADDLTDDAIIGKSVLILDQMKSFKHFTMKMFWAKGGVYARIFYIFSDSGKAFRFRQSVQEHCKHKEFLKKIHVLPWGIDTSAKCVWGHKGLPFLTSKPAEIEAKLFS